MVFSLFPDIFFLSPFAYTLLRFTAGCVFLLAAWAHYERRNELGTIPFMVIGKGVWIPVFASIIEGLTGFALILGVFTQAAAIAGALLAIKSFVWKRRYSAMFPLSRTASALLFVICLSLVVTGAGALAVDLPL
jgi:uncharacterized membrane protein YphA (DoxX/SURF4 family)